MTREGVLITTLNIEKLGQIKLFQIKIPREIKNVIGIEMGLRIVSGIPNVVPEPSEWVFPIKFNRNIVFGELKFQSFETANVFYTGELTLNKNTDNADFTSRFFGPKPHTHEYSSYEDVSVVNGRTTILQGVYRDKYAGAHTENYNYKVNVYVWCESKDILIN